MITASFAPKDASVLETFLRIRRDTAAAVLRDHASQFPSVPADKWKAA